MAAGVCPRPNCITCQIDAYNTGSATSRENKNVDIGHNRHFVPNPLAEFDTNVIREWVGATKERIHQVYGPEGQRNPQVFNGGRAGGIKNHVQEINAELGRADFSIPKNVDHLPSLAIEVIAQHLREGMNELHQAAESISQVAKGQVNWRALGVDPQDATIRFTAIGREVCLV